MTTLTTSPTTPVPTTPVPTTVRIGLGLLGLVSLADLATPLLTDGRTPPMGIAFASAALGLASLVLVLLAWRRPRRGLLTGLLLLRTASAATAVPAFVLPDVPLPAVAAAGVVVALTVVGGLLLVPAFRRTR
ncbi:hypothetical protein [Pseudonocardia pini]|uniref:hypothetical protein n=1 Tax=Pseudonocardia pini TaxID=2758030 RepID=UPI0015F022D5|nr:hypothetical protein [Pseudonocardia pini]